ncbi:MAG: hypothetical protein ACYS9X_28915, partial [Planctomycetota bacterium]
RGDLPPPFQFGGKHVWLVGAILDHLTARQAAVVAEAKRRDDRRPAAFDASPRQRYTSRCAPDGGGLVTPRR